MHQAEVVCPAACFITENTERTSKKLHTGLFAEDVERIHYFMTMKIHDTQSLT
jgi:hypothetical protein